jgi:hypothetical protein
VPCCSVLTSLAPHTLHNTSEHHHKILILLFNMSYISHILMCTHIYTRLPLLLSLPQSVSHIKNAETTKCEHAGKVFSLSLLCEGKKAPLFIDCGKTRNQSDWFGALKQAAVTHEVQRKRAAVHLEVCSVGHWITLCCYMLHDTC